VCIPSSNLDCGKKALQRIWGDELKLIDNFHVAEYKHNLHTSRLFAYTELLIDRKSHSFTPDHAISGWNKVPVVKIVGREHSKIRPYVLEARMCANYDNFGFVYLYRIIFNR
jgi:hypothetical protein